MTKLQFLLTLHDKLSGLPKDEVEERLNFYSEMIEDRMEEGLTEQEAVAAVGLVDEIAVQIIADTPLAKIAKEKIKPKRRLKVWEIVLLAVGSPIWVSLLIAAVAVVFSLYVALWSVVVSLWAVFASFVGSALGAVVGGVIMAIAQNVYSGLALIAAGFVCTSLAIFLFFGCKAVAKATVSLTKKMILGLKSKCIGKEKV